MPEPGGFGECEFFNNRFFNLKVCYHLLYRNSIITDCGCFAITRQIKLIQAYNEYRLMCFCSAGDRKWIFKTQIIRNVMNFHFGILSTGGFYHFPELFVKWFRFDKVFKK